MSPKRPILIGNISGCVGDRVDGMKSMLSGQTVVDALTGDWLSEANLAWRAVEASYGMSKGYEPGFLHSFRLALDAYFSYPRRVRVVVNAGCFNPQALAKAIQSVLSKRNSDRKVAYILGDNVLDLLTGEEQNLTESNRSLKMWMDEGKKPVAANAYIGAWGIVDALNLGADIVICGRCTDASPVIGLAAWWHGWKRDNFEKLARTLVAGHLVECGCYVTGGNFPGFERLMPNYYDLSFPIAEIGEDGTAVIQKQPDQNGLVSVDTVETQFLYELQGVYYYNPDAIADCRNIKFDLISPGKVRISGVSGLPAPSTAKVAVFAHGGYSCEFSIYPTGLDISQKVRSFETMTRRMLDMSKFDTLEFQTFGSSANNPTSENEATVDLRVFAQAKNKKTLEKANFYGPVLGNILQAFPAFTPNFDTRMADPKPYLTYFPCLMPVKKIKQIVHLLDDHNQTEKAVHVQNPIEGLLLPPQRLPQQLDMETRRPVNLEVFGKTAEVQLGRILYARSGDKGPNVNVGFFFPEDEDPNNREQKWDWLRSWLTTQRLRYLLAKDDSPQYRIERCEFPNIHAVHFVIHGILGAGISSTSRIDSLGKNIAEYLRARRVSVPGIFIKQEIVRSRL